MKSSPPNSLVPSHAKQPPVLAILQLPIPWQILSQVLTIKQVPNHLLQP